MEAGVSTACMYPKLLEEALYELVINGIGGTEMFINADCELRKPFIATMRELLDRFGARCYAVHPFAAPIEPFMMFTAYQRRADDMVDYYKRTFEAMHVLGAKIFIFHGNTNNYPVSAEFYCERFGKLVEAGKRAGVVVCQENIVRCQSGSLKFLREMRDILKDDAHFVLDVKQAVRAGENPVRMVQTLGDSIAHVHISDNGELGDCLLLGKGRFPIRGFLEEVHKVNPSASIVLELYRSNYRGISDLVSNYRMLDAMCKRISGR